MRQDTRVFATTDIRRWLRALRPLLMLGGFVVVWWCLATGTAQASEGPHHDLGATTKALGGTVDRVVHRTTERTVGHVQRASHSPKVVSKTTSTVRHHVAPVRAVVEKTVEQTPVKPVVKPVVKAVTTQVAPVLEKVEKAVAKTPLGPVVSPVIEDVTAVGHTLPVVGESAVLTGETASVQVIEETASTVLPDTFSDTVSGTSSDTVSSRPGPGSSEQPGRPRRERPRVPPGRQRRCRLGPVRLRFRTGRRALRHDDGPRAQRVQDFHQHPRRAADRRPGVPALLLA